MLDSNIVKEKLSTDDVIKLMCALQGDDHVSYDSQGHPIFNTRICHRGDSDKLYYYPETKMFHCYTCGASGDIFHMTSRALECDFREAFKYVINMFSDKLAGVSIEEPKEDLLDDWDIFYRIQDFSKNKEETTPEEEETHIINENIVQYFFPQAAPIEWQKEGITPEVMRYYDIRIDGALHHIVIPHRDINGNLIGIRRRSFNPVEVADGKKYMPVMIQGDIYRHSLGKNLFGLYQNKETIKRLKKVCIFEAEKSVLQIASMYGIDNCFAVATCGSSLSETQMNLLLKLGVTEIIIAFDADHLGDRNAEDTLLYEQKLRKIAEPWLPYTNVSIIFDYDHLLPHKASPSDVGKEIFEKLYHSRVRLKEIEEPTKKKKIKEKSYGIC